MTYKVIDNYLPENIWQQFVEIALPIDQTTQIPLYYSPFLGTPEDTSDYHFIHWLYEEDEIKSDFFQFFVSPLKQRLKEEGEFRSLIRARINWYPKNKTNTDHQKHVDNTFQHQTMVYYINTNNGGTKLHLGEKEVIVESVSNRALIFDGLVHHNSISHTDTNLRCIVNINFL